MDHPQLIEQLHLPYSYPHKNKIVREHSPHFHENTLSYSPSKAPQQNHP